MRIETKNGSVVLEVDDDELADLVDDHLSERCDLPPDGFQHVGSCIRLWFGADVSVGDLMIALNQLDPEEVERVFRLNNPRLRRSSRDPKSARQRLDR